MRRLARLAAAPIIAVLLSVAPAATVLACSCAPPPAPAELIATAEMALVGTVEAVAEAPAGDFGGMFAYAFDVERANRPVPALVEVRAVGGDGGASCGMEFGVGERWFIAAYRGPEAFETGLCTGNVLLDPADPDAGAEFLALLGVEPEAAAEDASEVGFEIPAGVVAIAASIGLVLVGSALAFRHERGR